MNTFWRFAREMLVDRWTLAVALSLSVIASAGLGVGLAGIAPILETMLPKYEIRGEERVAETTAGLRERVETLNTKLAEWPVAVQVPTGIVNRLPTDPFKSIVFIMIGISVLNILALTAMFLHQYIALTVVYRASQRIRDRAFSHVLSLPLSAVVMGDSSDISRRVVDETERLAEGFTALVSKAAAQIGKGLAALMVAIYFEWRITIVSLIIAPILWLVIRTLSRKVRKARKRAFRGQAALLSRAGNALRGLRVVKVQTAEEYEQRLFAETNENVIHQMFKARTARALSSPISEFVALSVIAVLAVFAAKAIIDQQLDPRHFVIVLIALGVSAASLRPLTGIVNEIQAAAAASDRLAELMDLDPEPGLSPRLPELSRHKSSIAFEGVNFTYPSADRPALIDVSLEVAHGERVAFVGPNGSGKTTILSLVPRLLELNSGRVLVDGQDITEFGIESLRRQIGAVTQETVIFPGSIRSNMVYGSAGKTDEEIASATKRAHADDFIDRLDQGLDTPVGEQGLTLSGGQRQRLSIARVILRDPAILILDEATSMIDADSEAKIADALDEFSAGRTTLIVAHRLSTVVNADRIVVMEAGRIIDQGTHQELLARCETYRTLARTQLVGSG
ncbi:MAG: ABC transporter ATP-binding protein [Phycisphaera sp.]|nr:MAG: ABC transporter ATP-binding protein [Phycisphaera sp.]